MNYDLKNLPERTSKPRQYGFTMAMDKGLSVREAEDFVSICADHVDIVKLGWATSFVTPNLKLRPAGKQMFENIRERDDWFYEVEWQAQPKPQAAPVEAD